MSREQAIDALRRWAARIGPAFHPDRHAQEYGPAPWREHSPYEYESDVAGAFLALGPDATYEAALWCVAAAYFGPKKGGGGGRS